MINWSTVEISAELFYQLVEAVQNVRDASAAIETLTSTIASLREQLPMLDVAWINSVRIQRAPRSHGDTDG